MGVVNGQPKLESLSDLYNQPEPLTPITVNPQPAVPEQAIAPEPAAVSDLYPEPELPTLSSLYEDPKYEGVFNTALKAVGRGGLQLANKVGGTLPKFYATAASEMVNPKTPLGRYVLNPLGHALPGIAQLQALPPGMTEPMFKTLNDIADTQQEAARAFYEPAIQSKTLAPDPALAATSYGQALSQGDGSMFVRKLANDLGEMTPSMAAMTAAAVIGGPAAVAVVGGGESTLGEFEAAQLQGDENALQRSIQVGGTQGIVSAIPFARPLHKLLPSSIAGKVMSVLLDGATAAGSNIAGAPAISAARLTELPKDREGLSALLTDMKQSVMAATDSALPSAIAGMAMVGPGRFLESKLAATAKLDALQDDLMNTPESEVPALNAADNSLRGQYGVLAPDVNLDSAHLKGEVAAQRLRATPPKPAVEGEVPSGVDDTRRGLVMMADGAIAQSKQTGRVEHGLYSSTVEDGIRMPDQNLLVNLHAGSRALLSIPRWEGIEKQGMYGYWTPEELGLGLTDDLLHQTVKKSRIALSDVQGTRTLAHELGHNIDHLMDPVLLDKNARDRFKWQDRVQSTLVPEDVLRQEMWTLSQKMRPDYDQMNPNSVAYRQQSIEQFADWYSAYAIDPEYARRYAPNFTSLYESRLGNDTTGVADVVHQIQQGHVVPVPGAERAQTLPGQIPDRAQLMNAATRQRDFQVRNTVQDLHSRLVDERRASTTQVWSEMRRLADKTIPEMYGRKVDKPEMDSIMQDATAFIEGTHNVNVKDDTRADVLQRVRSDKARQLAVNEARLKLESMRGEINTRLQDMNQQQQIAFLEDYVTHAYANGNKTQSGNFVGKWLKNTPNAKKRELPTYADAVEAGLTPMSTRVDDLVNLYAETNYRYIATQEFLNQMADMKATDGKPVVQSPDDAKGDPNYMKAPDNYILNKVFAIPRPNGTVLLKDGAVYVHKDAMPAIRKMVQKPLSNEWVNGIETAQAIIKQSMLFSFFHHVTLREQAVSATGRLNDLFGLPNVMGAAVDPRTGQRQVGQTMFEQGRDMMSDPAMTSDAARAGVVLNMPSDFSPDKAARALRNFAQFAKDSEFAKKVPLLGTAGERVVDFHKAWNKSLWEDTHLAGKLWMYHDLVKRYAESGNRTDEQIGQFKKTVAKFTNDTFGGQDMEKKYWMSPGMEQAARLVMLAPDWTISTYNTYMKTLFNPDPNASSVRDLVPGGGQKGTASGAIPEIVEAVKAGQSPQFSDRTNMSATYIRNNVILALIGLPAALQAGIYSVFGDKEKGDKMFPWQNEHGEKFNPDVTPLMRYVPGYGESTERGQRFYTTFGKPIHETMRWFTDPANNFASKSSPMVHMAVSQFFGSDGPGFDAQWVNEEKGFYASLPARAKSLFSDVAPMAFSGKNFAFSLPMHAGTTKYSATKAVKDILDLYADPTLLKKVDPAMHMKFDSYPEYTNRLQDLTEDVLDAASRNGLDPKEVLNSGIAVARGNIYRKFLAAVEDGDEGDMERYATSIVRLHGGVANVAESAKRRGIVLNDEERRNLMTALQGARANLTR